MLKRQRQEQKKQLKCPRGIILIVVFTICISLVELGEGVHDLLKEEGFQYFIQGTWLIGIGITEIIVGIFTLRAKGWAWKSNVVTQLAAIVLWTTSLIAFFSNPPSINEEDAQVVAAAPPSLILLQIIIGILVLGYLFTPKVRSYFGKSNFSLRHLMDIDAKGAWDYLHHLWIASLFTAVLFSIIGFLLLFMKAQDFNAMLIVSLLFISAGVILGQAYEACKRKSRVSSILLFVIFMVTTGLLAYLSIDIYANNGGFWSLSAEILGIPLFQGVRCIFVISRTSAL